MNLKFNICTTHQAPAMSHDRVVFVGTTEQAIAAAEAQHAATGRTVALMDNECGSYCWRLWQGGKVTLDRLTA
jgi:hypothetical protein